MTTSLEYEEKAQFQIDHIDDIGMKAIETAKIYSKLAVAAAIREQAAIMRNNDPRSFVTGNVL